MRRLRTLAAAALLASAARAEEPAYWGTPSAKGGACCASLGEVRQNIDRIDAQLITLMAERGQYVAEAGRFKKDRAAVSAPARVEAIITRVREKAEAAGLAPDVAERTYRAMIAAFEDFERARWAGAKP